MDRGVSIIEATIAATAEGWRMDRALAEAVPTLSRERLKVLINAGQVTQDGVAIRDPARKLKGGERFSVSVPAPLPAHNEAQDIPLVIVFEDEHLIVIDKPAGLVVHPAAGNLDGTLVNALLHHCGGSLSGIGGVARPGIVHRIDKDTSGLMVAAKTDRTHEGLAKQFAAHSIDRRYRAIVGGSVAAGRHGRCAAGALRHQSQEGGDRRGRQARGDPLSHAHAAAGGGAGGMPAGNRPHASGARTYGVDRACLAG